MTDISGATSTPPPPVIPPRARRGWRRHIGIALLGVLAVLAGAASIVKVPYVIISPGGATPLDDQLVTVTGAESYPHDGEFLYLTVGFTNRDPNVWRWLFAQLDDDDTVVKREEVIGCASYAENQRFNDVLMNVSQDTAKTLALHALGYDVTVDSSSVVITGRLCGGPSDGLLEVGDTIVAVDGTAVTVADEVPPLVQMHDPGDTVTVTVERGGTQSDVSIPLGKKDGKGYLGIQPETLSHQTYPFDIDIDIRRVGGPSAGLAFTLAVIDDLSPGNLTGGRTVAVTGAVRSDGAVTDVGGVKQKTIVARASGATLMLVPVGEAKEAREHAEGMRVVAVATVDDALKALARYGGDPIATTSTTVPMGQ
jgi:Lon-like protease